MLEDTKCTRRRKGLDRERVELLKREGGGLDGWLMEREAWEREMETEDTDCSRVSDELLRSV